MVEVHLNVLIFNNLIILNGKKLHESHEFSYIKTHILFLLLVRLKICDAYLYLKINLITFLYKSN